MKYAGFEILILDFPKKPDLNRRFAIEKKKREKTTNEQNNKE